MCIRDRGCFVMFSMISVLCIVFVYVMVPETKVPDHTAPSMLIHIVDVTLQLLACSGVVDCVVTAIAGQGVAEMISCVGVGQDPGGDEGLLRVAGEQAPWPTGALPALTAHARRGRFQPHLRSRPVSRTCGCARGVTHAWWLGAMGAGRRRGG